MEMHRLQVALNEQPEEQHRQLDDLHKQVAVPTVLEAADKQWQVAVPAVLEAAEKQWQVPVPAVLEAAEKQWQGASYQHHVGMMTVEAK